VTVVPAAATMPAIGAPHRFVLCARRTMVVRRGAASLRPNSRVQPNLVLVTGAGGFLGREICRSWRHRDIRIRAVVRSHTGAVEDAAEVIPIGDLLTTDRLDHALAGVDTVIHLAGRVHEPRERPADGAAALAMYRRTNVGGTRRVLEAAAAARVRAFVYISSVKAVGERNESPWTEDVQAHPEDAYGISKLESEAIVRDMARSEGISAAILRLPLVYGPGMRANMLRLFDVVAKRVPLPFGAVQNRRSLVFSGNVVAAIDAVLATEPSLASGEVFFVSDGEDVSTAELARRIGNALGSPPVLIPVPDWMLRWSGKSGDLFATVIPAWPLTSAIVARLVDSLSLDISKLRRLTGFEPRFTMREGLRCTAAWYRHRPTDSKAVP